MLKLYKYLSPDRVEILQNCLTRYTPPGALNDPFEMRLAPWFKSLFPPNAVHRYSGKIANVTKITEWMEKDFHKGLLVFCLTERNDNHLMWSHYAANHQGFVIGFNSEHPCFNERRGPHDEFRHLKKVEYRNIRPNQAKDYSVVDVLLTKSKEWEHEQEWRIFRMAKDADEVKDPDAPYPVYLFRFPPEAIVEVILGRNMSEENREGILSIVKNSSHLHHVSLLQACLVDEDYQIRFKKITL